MSMFLKYGPAINRFRAMMEYLTYAHILYGEVYQVGDFGAVALWYVPKIL